MDSINQREIIVYALIDITEMKGYNNIVLKQTLAKNNALTKTQKAFITQCVNGTLRNLILIDFIINSFSNTNTKKMKPLILNILRSSVYQLKFMDKVPESAICNEAVNLTKAKGFKNLSGFVNGVIRNIIRNIDNIKYPDEQKEPVEYLETMYSVEKWLINYWLEDISYEAVKAICIAQNKDKSISLCVNTLKTDREELIKILKEEEITVIEDNYLENSIHVKNTSDITKKKSFQDGLYHIMDESSMLSVKVLNPCKDEIIFDMCAAPGGKSFLTSYLMKDTGKIFSYDIHPHKIDLIKSGVERLGIKNIITEINNAEIFNKELENKADRVLIDAPCTGFGMLQRKPDIKYSKTMEDVNSLVKVQRKILASCQSYVKIGGTLVYSTCTISRKENMENINWFLEKYNYELSEIPKDVLGKFNFDTIKSGFIQLLPDNNNTDGFFIACMKRKG